jgi:hypothetical protein
VVLDCHEFSVLPPVEEFATFYYELVLKEPEDKVLFSEMENLYPDEDGRKYLLQMKSEESTEKLAELLSPGVTWTGYWNAEKNRDVIVHGFSMQKPIMDITVSGVGYWNTEGVVRGVVGKWGEVKKLTKVNFTLHGHTFGTDQWEVKLVKNKEIVIPPVVFHLGSDRSSEEREKWKVSYRGMPRICYRCLKEGHVGRECMDNPVDIEQLASDAAFEEAPAAPRDNDVISGEKRTFAQIVKDTSYVQIRLARVRAEEQRKEEVAAKVREAREERESRKKEKERMRKEKMEKKVSSDSDSDSDTLDAGEKGFSIPRSTASSPLSLSEQNKRALVSPAALAPGSKTPKLHRGDSGSMRSHGSL